uniref:TM2 domain-containing protein n=1 Tax=Oryzias sinensis TaxID=183150 RepID=A0A8C7WXQ8_9TELE
MAFPLRKRLRCFLPFLLLFCVCSHLELVFSEDVERCEHLRLGQYLCKDPKIDDATQEPENCRNMQAQVECFPAPNISCRLQDGREVGFGGEFGFNRSIPCRNVSGYSYKVAVALSLFLGWLGADRFYLGYPALGTRSHMGGCGWMLTSHTNALHLFRHIQRLGSRLLLSSAVSTELRKPMARCVRSFHVRVGRCPLNWPLTMFAVHHRDGR